MRRISSWLHDYRFTAQLAALTLLLLLFPFFERGNAGRLLLHGFSLLLVAFVINAVSANRRQLAVGLALAAPEIVIRLAEVAAGVEAPRLTAATSALFLGYATLRVLRVVLTSDEVTFETVAGALCAYLLFGLVWASFYSLIELGAPGSFRLTDAARLSSEALWGEMVFFSYVTQTTLGYGDIVPVSPPARSVATVQALLAQIYLATLVARLVAAAVIRRR